MLAQINDRHHNWRRNLAYENEAQSQMDYVAIVKAHVAWPDVNDKSKRAKILRALEVTLQAPDIDIDIATRKSRDASDALQRHAEGMTAAANHDRDEWQRTALAMGDLRTAVVKMWREDSELSLTAQRNYLQRVG